VWQLSVFITETEINQHTKLWIKIDWKKTDKAKNSITCLLWPRKASTSTSICNSTKKTGPLANSSQKTRLVLMLIMLNAMLKILAPWDSVVNLPQTSIHILSMPLNHLVKDMATFWLKSTVCDYYFFRFQPLSAKIQWSGLLWTIQLWQYDEYLMHVARGRGQVPK